ncbi:hypothetical protein Q5424_18715 [Conexibacter sp. JD483]|uniref:hypothetical protein n=1 Tax=unclassified Conexibacter TaxID=2627773 RepID=UPI002722B8E2|nr:MULTISPECIES: hypothetical protein [unclassified Conexibacter]MDO8186372.1 hypothetical protein [Conexibacter sp. CPCC 205706]MDO8199771.1 hypothetical protein [Conexibacter sp. CPCC 205762]MDR9371136.1 hypothetical protein [Conexibacter sp. JD483]
MSVAHLRARACSLLRILACAAVSLTVVLLLSASQPATADCVSGGGSSCLPGAGYVNSVSWSCVIDTADCYYDSVTDSSRAASSDFGWGAASYSGAGSVFVCIRATGSLPFIGCAYDLARACALASCDDQDLVLMKVLVQNQSGVSHTINGRAQG